MNLYYIVAIWMAMALAASLISIRIAIPVALVEIVVGAVAAGHFMITEDVRPPAGGNPP